MMTHYKPLEVKTDAHYGFLEAMIAMRLPKGSLTDSCYQANKFYLGRKDAELASALIKGGDDHAKAMRGIVVWATLKMQVGFMIEFETYRHGVECLSTSSAMHGELKGLSGGVLAEQKQADLPDKVYTRSVTLSYQALRSMYRARKGHRHPDWKIFCNWIENLPHFESLIYP
jgi:hypothetical protein